MPSSTRSNKETQLLFSSNPATLERSIRKGIHFSSIDNNTCSALNFCQPPSTQTPVSSIDTRSPPLTEDTLLPSTDSFHLMSIDNFHPTSIDTSVRTLIDTEPRDMVSTLILVHDERGDLHDQEGHLRNAAGQRIDALGAAIPELQSKSIDMLSRALIDDTYGVNRILRCREDPDSRGVRIKIHTSAQPCLCQNRSTSDTPVDRQKENAIDR
ncbi:hypothetical protein F2Q69_00027614 [Brassica cretica]|uniref:Uncharacterized protein n=1 Tax=Brassica cretica TaxID=69181 RepID=A0A8S9S6C3_BRACR|nr:hypothetical protein F2Q69_00027614 [Brassica cretica]